MSRPFPFVMRSESVRSAMFVRFATHSKDSESLKPEGCFHAAARLRDSGTLSKAEMERLASIREWFNENLDAPDGFSRSKGPYRKKKGISWFRDSAREHIQHMRDMADILERHGIPVRQLVTDRPGYIIYQDEYQVCAEPFSDTPT